MSFAVYSIVEIQIPAAKKHLIDRAAIHLGQSRASFILEAAVERAKNVLGDQTRFSLSNQQMARFEAALEEPLPNHEALVELLRRRAPWTV